MVSKKRLGPGSVAFDQNGTAWYWPTTQVEISAARELVRAGKLAEDEGICEGCEKHEPGHVVPVFREV